jgi:hypothetical protein
MKDLERLSLLHCLMTLTREVVLRLSVVKHELMTRIRLFIF